MKNVRLWAQIQRKFMIISVIITSFGLSAAYPAGAQELQPSLVELDQPVKVGDISCRYLLDGPLPSSSTVADFSPWNNMHPHTFNGKSSSFVEQCLSTAGKLPWLTSKVCKDFDLALQQGNCAVVPNVNNINIDTVRGKRNGRSTAFLYEHMQLKESRQAVFVSLPGNLWLGMFAGESGKSCNNFFALKNDPPQPLPPVEVVAPPVPTGKWVCREVQFKDPVRSGTYQHLDGFLLEGCCCGKDKFIPSNNFYIGDDLKSSGHTEVCDWVQSN